MMTLVLMCARKFKLNFLVLFFGFLFHENYSIAQHCPIDTSVTVYFETGKFELDSASRVQLQATYKKLISDDHEWPYWIQISGFSDESGKDNMNLRLSENRAETVYSYFLLLAKDTVLRKTLYYSGPTACGGDYSDSVKAVLPISYTYYGEKKTKAKGAAADKKQDRSVVIRFQSAKGICGGVFGVCRLPGNESKYTGKNGIQFVLPQGQLDEYLIRLPAKCPYDSLALFKVNLIDSILDENQLCAVMGTRDFTNKKNHEIKLGRILIAYSFDGKDLPERVCENRNPQMRKAELLIPLALIRDTVNLIIYGKTLNGKETLPFTIDSGFVSINFYADEISIIELYTKFPDYKKGKLIIKGKTHIPVSAMEPRFNCMVNFMNPQITNRLFFNSTTVSILLFSKERTVLILNNGENNTRSEINLSDLKFSNRRRAYVISKKQLRTIINKDRSK